MRFRRLTTSCIGIALIAAVLPAAAQRVGSMAEWKLRVLDPAPLDIELFPGSQRNLKFTIDQIRLDESPAKMVVYIIEVDKMAAAAQFYAQQLDQPVEVNGVGTMGELHVVRASADDAKRAGLTVRVENAHWATGKGQVWMKYNPPGAH
jgi:hypothetical protein